MSKKVTIESLLGEEPYKPLPGTEYEVGVGAFVKMCVPTIGRIDAFMGAFQEMGDKGMENGDITLAKLVTDGTWPERDSLVPRMVSAIVMDFFRLATGQGSEPQASSPM